MTPAQIKSIRRDLKLTQAEFAKAVGVRQATVSDWEREASKPSRLAITNIKKLYEQRYLQSI